MSDTPVLALPYPVGSDTPDVPADIQALAEKVEDVLTPSGLASGDGLKWNGTGWVKETFATAAALAAVGADLADLADLVALPRRETHTWAIGGEIKVPSGDVDYIPPMHVSVGASETLKLVSARGRINGGTSATIKFQKNGSDITGWTGWVVNTTTIAGEALDPADETLADNDAIAIVVTAISGTPKNLSVTAVFERAVA